MTTPPITPAIEKKETVLLPPYIVVRDLASKLGATPAKIVAMLVKSGVMANMNERVDFDTAQIIADDLGVAVEQMVESDQRAAAEAQKAEDLLREAHGDERRPRPPVVVVMGHVDHGKTTLLDTIRKTNVAGKESGGITQHIGAYYVMHADRMITFIDTPGHEAFSAMRSRGANVADIAILVVAADDGLQPQTKEAIQIIKKAGLALVVAINKIDKPGADVDKVKAGLAEVGLNPEDWGGDTIIAQVSAKKGTGIDELLEMVLLVADMHKETIVGNPDRPAIGTIIESRIDPGEGPMATAIIQTGTIKVGDYVQVGDVAGKIKALRDFAGKFIGKAGPSMPARILGLKDLPQVGDVLQVVTAADVKDRLRKRKVRRDVEMPVETVTAAPSENDTNKKILPMILKADTVGSIEAILSGLQQIQHPDVAYKMLYKTLGSITEKDVLQAEATGALLLGFNVQATPSAEEVARSRNVTFSIYNVLYEMLDEVKKRLEELLEMEAVRTDVATLEVRGVFRTEKASMIIGGRIADGEIANGMKFRIERGGEEVGTGTVTQIQKAQEKVKRAGKGVECGVQYKGDPVTQVGDSLVFFTEEMRRQTLSATA